MSLLVSDLADFLAEQLIRHKFTNMHNNLICLIHIFYIFYFLYFHFLMSLVRSAHLQKRIRCGRCGLRLSPVIVHVCKICVEFADTSAAVKQGNQLIQKPVGTRSSVHFKDSALRPGSVGERPITRVNGEYYHTVA